MTKHDPQVRPGVGSGYASHLAYRTLRASVALSRNVALILIVGGLVGSWLVVFLAGGADSLVPHFYYIPILFAATRFGPVAALIVALIAGLLAGPLTYDEVAAGTAQDFVKWSSRAAFFIAIGQLAAWLVKPSLRPIGEELRRMHQEHEIRRGLAHNEFVLHYHPIYSVRAGRYSGVEALIRWQHPTRGMLSPAHFIEIAEDSNLIHEISDFVIEEACRQASAWRTQILQQGEQPWYVGINLSARDLERTGLAADISRCLSRHDLPPELLHIELTEGVLAFEGAAVQLRQLKKLGVKLAIDDFGTGYSSLSYLDRFPVDILKIDRSLISNLGPDTSSQALARGMILLAKSLGLTTVAEGLETAEQLAIGKALNFDYIQGYYFALPQAAEGIPELLFKGPAIGQQPDQEEHGS